LKPFLAAGQWKPTQGHIHFCFRYWNAEARPPAAMALVQAVVVFALRASGTAAEFQVQSTEPLASKLVLERPVDTDHVSLLQTKAQVFNTKSVQLATQSEAASQSRTFAGEVLHGQDFQFGSAVQTSDSAAQQSSQWLSVQQLAAMVRDSDAVAGSPLKTKVKVTTKASSPSQVADASLLEGLTGTGMHGPAKARTEVTQTVIMQGIQQTNGTDISPDSNVIVKHVSEVPVEQVPEKEVPENHIEIAPSKRDAVEDLPNVSPQAVIPSRMLGVGHATGVAGAAAAGMTARIDKLVKDAELVRDAFVALGKAKSGETLPPIGFIKTHRTGSSTLASIIHRVGDERNVSFILPAGGKQANNLGWPGPFPGPEAAAFNGAPSHQFNVLCNNAVFNDAKMRAYLKPSPLFFTVLRQPLDQMQSAFDFFKPGCGESWKERIQWLGKLGQDNAPNANLLQQHDTLTQAQQREINMQASFLNSQAHDLGWYEFVGNTVAHDEDDEAIHAWIDDLDDSFGLVMLTEYFNEGLLLLRRKLGVDVKDMAHIYMKKGVSRKSLPKEELQAMRHLNHVDTLLYNHFNRTFWREWDRAGGYSALGGELRQLHTMSEELEEACSKENASRCTWSSRTDTAEYTDFLRQKKLQLLGL